LKEIICEHLMEDPDIDASEVNIEVSGAVVTLTGSIEDRRTKYEIEDIIERIGGVRDINNQLKVERDRNRTQLGSQWNAGAGSATNKGAEKSAAPTSGSTSSSPGGTTSGGSSATTSSKKN
jgi:hypothetical protein